MKNIRYFIFFFLLLAGVFSSYSQVSPDSLDYIQFAGKVVTEDADGKVAPLPYTNVYIKNTSRGTSSEIDGFFSFVAKEGDTIVFSQIGYQSVEYVVPDTLTDNLYYWIQIMTRDNVLLPEAVIRAFPSREHFKIEFLALDVTEELENQYSEYLSEEIMDEIRYNLPIDGGEAVNLYMRQTVNNYKYSGQIKPQNIFNPLAWKQFIDAWKRGDFKSKDKKK